MSDDTSVRQVIWLTGNSGAGKTTTAYGLKKIWKDIVILDGDELRESISTDMGFHKMDRIYHNLRVARLAAVLARQGHRVIVSVICPYKGLRERVSRICDPKWVHIFRPGLDHPDRPYEISACDAEIRTDELTPEEAAEKLSMLICGWNAEEENDR